MVQNRPRAVARPAKYHGIYVSRAYISERVVQEKIMKPKHSRTNGGKIVQLHEDVGSFVIRIRWGALVVQN